MNKKGVNYRSEDLLQETWNPFRLQVDPMYRLLLLNFNNDVDEWYVGFEPQVFPGENDTEALLVIAWRKDGQVDVYHTANLKPDPLKYNIAGKGLNLMQETAFYPGIFEILDAGVRAEIGFRDRFDREVMIRILEEHPKPRKPFGLLAPMGMAAKAPTSMPLIWLREFYFIRKRHCDFHISIDGREHSPDKLPFPIHGCWMHFSRYSGNPFILTLNPDFEGLLENQSKSSFQKDYWRNSETISELEKIEVENGNTRFIMTFSPAFPDFVNMKEGQEAGGSFTISGPPECGKLLGSYTVISGQGEGGIILHPSGGWKHGERNWMLRLLYFFQRDFSNWPKTYRWEAKWKMDNGKCHFRSKWSRI